MRLSALRVDSDAIENGQWVKPGPEYDDLEILTRGYTDAYSDAYNLKLARAARAAGGDATRVSQAERRHINIECLIQHTVLDVRGLADDAGNAVTFGDFCALMRDPNYTQLVVAVQMAAAQVGRMKADEAKDAAGN